MSKEDYLDGYRDGIARNKVNRATIIEECALLADEMNNHYGDAIATAIRALKDKS